MENIIVSKYELLKAELREDIRKNRIRIRELSIEELALRPA